MKEKGGRANADREMQVIHSRVGSEECVISRVGNNTCFVFIFFISRISDCFLVITLIYD